MYPEYAKAIGRAAYIWGWPMVNMTNRRATITKAPFPGLLNGVLPARRVAIRSIPGEVSSGDQSAVRGARPGLAAQLYPFFA
jgi:hypothetical protein